MHEWHTNKSTNPLKLIDEFTGFEYDTDYAGRLCTRGVVITSKLFSNEDEARAYVTRSSYYSDHAYMAAYTDKKLSKGYMNAFYNFITKYNEYTKFKDDLNISYGRKANKVTCPKCGSSINLKYGGKFKVCPVCGSSEIISESNWKTLDTKLRMTKKAAENLSNEASKNNVTFMCGMEWHC